MNKITELQNKNFVMAILGLGIVLIIIAWRILVWNDTRIIKIDSEIIKKLDQKSEYEVCVDLVEFSKDNYPITKDWIIISGWLICKEKPVSTATIKIVLKRTNTDDYYILPTTMSQRADVTETMNSGVDYDWSGFEVKIPRWGKIDIDKYDYEIYALYNLNGEGEKLVDFNTAVKEWKKDE